MSTLGETLNRAYEIRASGVLATPSIGEIKSTTSDSKLDVYLELSKVLNVVDTMKADYHGWVLEARYGYTEQAVETLAEQFSRSYVTSYRTAYGLILRWLDLPTQPTINELAVQDGKSLSTVKRLQRKLFVQLDLMESDARWQLRRKLA